MSVIQVQRSNPTKNDRKASKAGRRGCLTEKSKQETGFSPKTLGVLANIDGYALFSRPTFGEAMRFPWEKFWEFSSVDGLALVWAQFGSKFYAYPSMFAKNRRKFGETVLSTRSGGVQI